MIRHGQASFGADDYDVLSERGVRQAEILGQHLAQLDVRFDRAVAGSLLRQQHTGKSALAQLQAAGIATPELDTDEAFNEFDADALDTLRNAANNRAEFQRLFALLIGRWISGEHPKPGLQSWQEFVEQVEGGLARILERASSKDNIAVFTSGGTITAMLHLITAIPAAQAFELNWQIVNTSLNRFKFRGREVALASFNSHAHLELLKAPELITFR
jgi:broad specificity phosphatase PhoE